MNGGKKEKRKKYRFDRREVVRNEHSDAQRVHEKKLRETFLLRLKFLAERRRRRAAKHLKKVQNHKSP